MAPLLPVIVEVHGPLANYRHAVGDLQVSGYRGVMEPLYIVQVYGEPLVGENGVLLLDRIPSGKHVGRTYLGITVRGVLHQDVGVERLAGVVAVPGVPLRQVPGDTRHRAGNGEDPGVGGSTGCCDPDLIIARSNGWNPALYPGVAPGDIVSRPGGAEGHG